MQGMPSTHDPRVPGTADNQTSHINMAHQTRSHSNHISCEHSKQKLDEIQDRTDLVKCRINNEEYDCQYKDERRGSTGDAGRCESHKKPNLYGNKSITRRTVACDVYGDASRTADLKFKCVRDGRERLIGRTMGRVHSIALFGLFLAILATCAAAPTRSRRSHHERSARDYLETFGYLKRGRPEVGNLLMADEAQNYEDDFRIAIKTLQEFGGVPVTGEIDEHTLELMKKRRCGRPDREEGDDETGHRRKRFAIQGGKWEHTNITWSLSQDRRPSQLDPHGTRSVLARALDVWAQASRLTFQEINSDKADIVVSFAKRFHDDAYPFDGRGSILAHAFFPGTGRGGDAHFDDDELWLLQPKNDDEEGTSLFAVAAHEFGHSLGLSHSSVRGALMYPWYQGIQQNFVLPQDDRNGIQQMYGPKENNRWAQIPNYRPIETPPPTTPSTTTTTTPRYPTHHHPNRHPNRHPYHRPNYPQYPRDRERDRERERDPSKYPSYYPQRPHYFPNVNNYPEHERPSDYPTRRQHNTTYEHPGRPSHHYPRTTTTAPTTYRPRYPNRTEYPRNRPSNREPETRRPQHNTPPRPTATAKPVTTPAPDIPDECDTNYDAVTLIRNELFLFKGKYHWRIGAHGRYKNYPMEIKWMWRDLPADLTHVDAVYERSDKKIVFFIGKLVYLFDLQTLVPGYPRPLTSLGLPESLERLDAAMVWGHNSKTYFYSGTMYWKFDDDEGRVELDYPRNMAMWKGVGYNIDSVFQWKDGKTYFFKGKGFWKFNDLQMRVEHEKQLPSAQFWMACPSVPPGTRSPYRALPAPGSTLRSPSSSTTNYVSLILLAISTIIAFKNDYKY